MEEVDIVAEELANKARESLSSYCINECKAKCCRMGFLLLTEAEVPLFKNTFKENLRSIPIQEDKKEFILNLNKGGCPNLKDNKCTIHTNPLRPKTCSSYPLFVRKNKTILISNTCEGVRENKLYPFLAEFKQKGYTLTYTPIKD